MKGKVWGDPKRTIVLDVLEFFLETQYDRMVFFTGDVVVHTPFFYTSAVRQTQDQFLDFPDVRFVMDCQFVPNFCALGNVAAQVGRNIIAVSST
jgi:hypothetical protein